MQLEVKTKIRIGAPAHEVFEAIIDPAKMSQYFITEASGPMEAGKTISWTWADYNTTINIHVQKVEKNHYISFTWPGSDVETIVDIQLDAETESVTSVTIKEKDWHKDDKGIQRLTEQTQGWLDMLLCLKAFVQYGINLRKV